MTWRHERSPPCGSDLDEHAMRKVQLHGDHAAFAELIDRWEAPIRRLCIRMTCDEHRGEDLAQDVFARVFIKRAQFDPLRKFSTWLWRIALNVCLAESRRTVHLAKADDGVATTAQCRRELPPDERLVAQERVEQVKIALSRLSDAYRAVVVLREYEGLKYREIAEVLEIPEGTVKWRMADWIAGRHYIRLSCESSGYLIPRQLKASATGVEVPDDLRILLTRLTFGG